MVFLSDFWWRQIQDQRNKNACEYGKDNERVSAQHAYKHRWNQRANSKTGSRKKKNLFNILSKRYDAEIDEQLDEKEVNRCEENPKALEKGCLRP